MKSLICKITFIVLVIFCSSNLLSAQAKYVSYENTTLDATLKYRVSLMNLALEADGYQLTDYTLTTLKKGETFEGATTCYQGEDYIIYAIGGKGIKDLDLYAYESDGKLITYTVDNTDIGITSVKYRMYGRDDITLKVKNYGSNSNYKEYQVALLVYYKPR